MEASTHTKGRMEGNPHAKGEEDEGGKQLAHAREGGAGGREERRNAHERGGRGEGSVNTRTGRERVARLETTPL